MSKNVRYETKMRDRAKSEQKWLVTIDVDGKHLKDDSCCVQIVADMQMAKKLASLAVSLLQKQLAGDDQGRDGRL